MNYEQFLKQKEITIIPTGFEPVMPINDKLFPFQRDIVKWAIRRGRCALFQDCGLGKTIQQLEWASHVHHHTSDPVLILAPLAVSKQTKREGEKFGYKVTICYSADDVRDGINITNYEKLHKFIPSRFSGIVADESGILKNLSGVLRNEIIDAFKDTPYKLACTATPAPNDYMELGNHAEFVGVMTYREMLTTFFVHDGGETQKWRLKGHAEADFWKWMCSWSVYIKKPSDIGYQDGGFILPPISVHEVIYETDPLKQGAFITIMAKTLDERREARRDSVDERVAMCKKIIDQRPDEPWLIWCNLNVESEKAAMVTGLQEITGADSDEKKERLMFGFIDGDPMGIVSKPKIAGHGLNWQHCANMIFLGLSDSWEQYYQAVRRCWRFGQTRPVNVYIVISDREGAVIENIKRKEEDADRMATSMIANMADISSQYIKGTTKEIKAMETDEYHNHQYDIYLGDCVQWMRRMEDGSIDYSVYSPPFAELYTYSDMIEDMGNARNYDVFFSHYRFMVAELFRLTRPGRLTSFHCVDIPSMKERDGVIGLKDFPGDLIRCYQEAGWIYHGKHVIWKDPLIEATRTKSLGLMHKQLMKDSAMCRAGLPDYLITMRKPGTNDKPISHPHGFTDYIGESDTRPREVGDKFSHHVWQKYASPVWMDIRQTHTLQKNSAREHEDEKHICPLALDVIERALALYSAVGDRVLDPFGGIGSTGYVALKNDRRFVGIELKKSYYDQMYRNLLGAKKQASLFDGLDF